MRNSTAYPVYLAMRGATALSFSLVFTISAIYRIRAVGLNPFELVLVGTVLEASLFAFEIPTGIVADLYSRRTSIIIGMLLIGSGFLLEGSFPIYAAVLGAQVLWGVGFTFTSGADAAWIADELGVARVGRVYVRGAQVAQAGTFVGIFASVALASLRLNLPIVLAGISFIVIGLALAVAMPETGFVRMPPSPRNTWSSMLTTFQIGLGLIRRRPVLASFVGISLFYGLSSEGFDRLWELHFLRHFTFPGLGGLDPIIWFGIINGAAMLLSIMAAEVAQRTVNVDKPVAVGRVLVGLNLLLVAAMMGFGLAGRFGPALALYWAAFTLRQTNEPLLTSWLNHRVESGVRATVISMTSQVNALGQIVGGPIIGAIAAGLSTGVALVAGAVILVPVVVLYSLAVRGEREAVDS